MIKSFKSDKFEVPELSEFNMFIGKDYAGQFDLMSEIHAQIRKDGLEDACGHDCYPNLDALSSSCDCMFLVGLGGLRDYSSQFMAMSKLWNWAVGSQCQVFISTRLSQHVQALLEVVRDYTNNCHFIGSKGIDEKIGEKINEEPTGRIPYILTRTGKARDKDVNRWELSKADAPSWELKHAVKLA